MARENLGFDSMMLGWSMYQASPVGKGVQLYTFAIVCRSQLVLFSTTEHI